MKNYVIHSLYMVVLTCFFTAGCTSDFDEINTDPTASPGNEFNPNYLLTTAQLAYTGSNDFAYDTWRANLIYSATMMQGMATVVSYWAGDKYQDNPAYTSAYWERAYDEQIKRIVDIVAFTKDKPEYNNIYQVGRIWRAMAFQRMTDLYGDVPYSEAGGAYYTGILYPKFDSQESIYTDILKEVDEAINAINTSGDAVTGDVVFNGDLAKWQRFGYSLMLRMAMRLTKVDENLARSYVEKAIGKTMNGNEDNALLLHDESGGRATQNRNSQVLLGDGGQENYYVKWANTFIDFLRENDDPRLDKIAVHNIYLSEGSKDQNPGYVVGGASQKGMPNGKDLSNNPLYRINDDPSYTTFPDYSSPHPQMISRTAPTFIFTYAESEFLLAEASVRWGLGSATEHYKNGLKASLTFLSQWSSALAVSDGEAETYASAHPLDMANALTDIGNQYWANACTSFNFYEAWFNWRRTALPALTPINYINNSTNATIPRRFPYPIAEENTNPENYRAASAGVTGGDLLTGRVWWDRE